MHDKTWKPLFPNWEQKKRIFFWKMSHSAKKCERWPSGFIKIHSVGKYRKPRREDPFETLKKFQKKTIVLDTVPEKLKGDPVVSRFCKLR